MKKYRWVVACSILDKKGNAGFCGHRNQKVTIFDCARCVGFIKLDEEE